jgi:hypothetical protein
MPQESTIADHRFPFLGQPSALDASLKALFYPSFFLV